MVFSILTNLRTWARTDEDRAEYLGFVRTLGRRLVIEGGNERPL